MPVQKMTPSSNSGSGNKPEKKMYEKMPEPEKVNKADDVAKGGDKIVQENADKLGLSEEDTEKLTETSEKAAKGVDTATDVYESGYNALKGLQTEKESKPPGAPGGGKAPGGGATPTPPGGGGGGGAPSPGGKKPGGGGGTSGGMKRIVSGLRFWVQVDGIQVAGFSECSGLSVETEVFDYSEGGLNSYTHRLPVRTKYSNVTLKRGIDDAQDLQKWFMDSMNGNPAKRKTVAISLYDHDGNEIKKWELKGAYPVRWVGPDLRTDSGATAVETLEFAHDGFNTK